MCCNIIDCFHCVLFKLMVAGVNGAYGVSVLRQSMVYKEGLENVLIQSQHMVERNAMEPEQL